MAKWTKADRRLCDSASLSRGAELDDELLHLCCSRWLDEDISGGEIENDYLRLMLNQELFVFVTELAANGNYATNQKRVAREGTKCRNVIASVLQSICKQLSRFTLEVAFWLEGGKIRFARQVESRDLGSPGTFPCDLETSLLEQVVLAADASPKNEPV